MLKVMLVVVDNEAENYRELGDDPQFQQYLIENKFPAFYLFIEQQQISTFRKMCLFGRGVMISLQDLSYLKFGVIFYYYLRLIIP